MFTGIIEVLGTVASIEPAGELTRLAIDAPEIARDVRVGESVAVNGRSELPQALREVQVRVLYYRQ